MLVRHVPCCPPHLDSLKHGEAGKGIVVVAVVLVLEEGAVENLLGQGAVGVDGVGVALLDVAHLVVGESGNACTVLGETEGVEIAYQDGVERVVGAIDAVEGHLAALGPFGTQFLEADVIVDVVAAFYQAVVVVRVGTPVGGNGT